VDGERAGGLRRLLITACCLVAPLPSAGGQATPRAEAAATPPVALQLRGDSVRDTANLRAAIGFARLVADSAQADVIVGIRGAKSSGNETYELTFRGVRLRPGRVDTLSREWPAPTNDTARTQALAAAIKLGLLPYIERSPIRNEVGVQFAESAEGTSTAEKDRWNRWVMSLGLSGSLYTERLSRSDYLSYNVGIDRTTERSRVDLTGSLATDGSRYDIGEQSITNRNRSTAVSAVAVRRLGAHWGVGSIASVTTSTSLNQKFALTASPAIEWSVFPYDQFTTQQLAVQYAIGLDRFRYLEETIYGKLDETQPRHALSAAYTTTRRWGTETVSLLGSQYLRDPSKRRLTAMNNTSLSLAIGLSITAGITYALIRDQLYLPKGSATVEDVLLRRRQLETSYQYSLSLGFSYLFGSKGQAIPNPRLTYGSSAVSSVMF
jgi:hypothetical protein